MTAHKADLEYWHKQYSMHKNFNSIFCSGRLCTRYPERTWKIAGSQLVFPLLHGPTSLPPPSPSVFFLPLPFCIHPSTARCFLLDNSPVLSFAKVWMANRVSVRGCSQGSFKEELLRWSLCGLCEGLVPGDRIFFYVVDFERGLLLVSPMYSWLGKCNHLFSRKTNINLQIGTLY